MLLQAVRATTQKCRQPSINFSLKALFHLGLRLDKPNYRLTALYPAKPALKDAFRTKPMACERANRALVQRDCALLSERDFVHGVSDHCVDTPSPEPFGVGQIVAGVARNA